MIKCKNCESEFEKGKFCPDCGFPVDLKDSSSEALAMLKNIDARTKALEDRFTKADQRRKEKDEKTKTNKDARSSNSRGLLDIF